MEIYPYIVGFCRGVYITAGDPPLCSKEDHDREFERLKKQLDDIEKTKKRKEKYAKKYHN